VAAVDDDADDLGVVSACSSRCAGHSVVTVVRLLVEPRLHAGAQPGTEVAVDVQVLTEMFVADRCRVELRLPVLKLTPV